MSLDRLINAISGQESGGDYSAVNPNTGASGRFQIMPENWSSWATEAGLDADAPMSPENQDTVATYKLRDYYNKYGAKGAAIAWYAGEDATSWSQEALNRPQVEDDGTEYPSINQYANEVLERAGIADTEQLGSTSLFEGKLNNDPEGLGTFAPASDTLRAEIPTKPNLYQQFKDSLILSATDTFLVGGLRQRYVDITTNSLFDGQYTLTEEDKKFITTTLSGDTVAQEWVALNARNKNQMLELVNIKKQDLDRKERLARATGGWATAVQLAGGIVGGLLDPINLIPIGTSAKGLKTFSRLFPEGIITQSQSLSKIARYADEVAVIGSKTGAMNVAQGYLSEKTGGFEQDYASLFGFGVAFGGALHVVGDYLKTRPTTPEVKKFTKALDDAETDTIKVASDMKPSNIQFTLSKEKLTELSDKEYIKTMKNKTLSKLDKDGRVVVVDSAQLKAIATEANITLDDNTKAFYSKDTGVMMLVKDRIKKTDIDKIIAHELGVHGLPEVIGKGKYKALMSYVKREMKVAGSVFEASRKASGSYDPEEVLGYFIEHFAETKAGTDALFSRMVTDIKANFTRKGLKGEFTLSEIKNIVKQGLQSQLDAKLGITSRNPDGSVTFGNIKFSKENFANPLNLFEQIAQENLVIAAQSSKTSNEFLQKAFSTLETSSFSPANTFYGTFIQSPSPTMSAVARGLFVDPQKTRSYGLTAVAYRDRELRKLQATIYPVDRSLRDAYQKLGYKDIDKVNLDAIEVFDMKVTEGRSTSGTWGTLDDVPSEIMAVVNKMEKQRQASINFLENSSDMFLKDTTSPNILNKGKVKETGFYVAVDQDKLRNFLRQFNTLKEAQDWSRKYFTINADRVQILKELKEKAMEDYKQAQADGVEDAVLKEITKADVEQRIKIGADAIAKRLTTPDEFLTGMGSEGVWTGALGHLESRLPANRGATMELPDGTPVSFNSAIRNTDILGIQQGIVRRETGEGAFQAVFGDVENYKKTRSKIAEEIGDSSLSQVEKEKIMSQWDALINDLRGFPANAEPLGTLDAWGRVMTNIAYAKSGANFTWGHLTEIMTSMGQLGWRGITHSIPKVNDAIAQIVMDKDTFKMASWLADDMFAKTLHDIAFPFNKGIDYTIHSRFNSDSIHDKVIRTVSDFGVRAGRLTSALNQLPNLTYLFNKDVGKTLIADSINLVKGKTLETRGIYDNKALLGAAGIKDLSEITAPIEKYIINNKDNLKEGVAQWIAEDVDSYNKWYALIDNARNIIVTNPNKAGEHTLKNANIATRLMFQFRDFPMRVINSQFLGAFTRKDKGAYLTIMYSMLANGLIYTMQTSLKANLMFGDNETKRQEYLKERLNPAMIGASAFLRSSIGTLPSIGLDMVEVFTGSQVGRNIRNSLSTTYFEGAKQTAEKRASGTMQYAIGNAVARTPAIDSTIGQLSRAGAGAYNLYNGKGTKKDLDDIFSLFNTNFIPAKALQSYIIENNILTTLPDKRRGR